MFPMSQRGFSVKHPDDSEREEQVRDRGIKITIQEEIEDARYDGAKPIGGKPRRAYNYEVQYREVDPKLPLKKRLLFKTQIIVEDAIEYLQDFCYGRDKAIMFKTSAFIKRQMARSIILVHVYDSVKHGLLHVGHGLKAIFKDGKWAVKHKTRRFKSKYEDVSYNKRMKMKQVKQDYIKFVPFSLFILIPGGEALLPAWIMVFPNSIPSQFMSEAEREQKFEEMRDRQETSNQKLLMILPSHFKKLINCSFVNEGDQEDILRLIGTIKDEDSLPTDFLQFRHIMRRYAKFSMFETKQLVHMAHFMSVQPVTGLNTLNNILRFTGIQIRVDLPFIKEITRLIVARELNMLFEQIRREDMILSFEDLDAFTEEEMDKICFRRGIRLDKSFKEQKEDLKLWLSISNQRNVPNSLLLLTRLADRQNFEISDDENMDEILRRSIQDSYYIESVRVFEKAFGIDRLERILQNVQRKRTMMQQAQDDPGAVEHKFKFNHEDMMEQRAALDEFTTRHSTITQKINETYTIGNKILDYLEKEMILAYHFNGDQDGFEKDYPELVEKAKKYLGYDLYFDLSPLQGKRLHGDVECDMQKQLYDQLIEIQQKLNVQVDAYLSKHDVKIDKIRALEQQPTINVTQEATHYNKVPKDQPAEASEKQNKDA